MQETTPAKKGMFARLFSWIASRPAAAWNRIGPERRTRKAISVSTFVAALALGGYSGVRSNVSSDMLIYAGYEDSRIFGWQALLIDIGIGVGAAILITIVAWLALSLAVCIARWLPTATGKLGAGALLALVYMFQETGFNLEQSALMGGAVVLVSGAIFGSIASMTSPEFSEKRFFGKSTVRVLGLLGLGSVGVIVYAMMHEGTLDHLTEDAVYAAESEPSQLGLPDPGELGPHADRIATLTYGSGTDLHRPEFAEGATLKTDTVNGKPFVTLPKSHSGKLRKLFWDITFDKLPINGRVWYPETGDGPFPLVLVVHGNHNMKDFSDPGYEYLGEHLASHGYILASVDENFINGGLRQENDARGWLLLEHLKVWQGWNETSDGNPFFGKVDMDNITLMGHSRGGEAVTHAALFNELERYPDDASVIFDYGFSIKSIVSIAPVDGQYKPAGKFTELRDINYFTLHGSHDADVTSFNGDRIYNRLQFSEGTDYFKSTLYLYRANHGQFNTVWGPTDTGAPRSLLLNRAALLDGEDQRKIAKVFITAFLEASIRGDREYLPLFVNPRSGRDWLPDATLVSRYEDATFRLITDFEEDVDVTTTTIPGGTLSATGLVIYREGDIPMRGGRERYNQGVFLGWNNEQEDEDEVDTTMDEPVPVEASATTTDAPAPSFDIRLPDGFLAGLNLSGTEQLVLHVAEVDEKPKAKDYSMEKEEDEGQQEEEGATENENEEESEDEEEDEEEDKPKRPPLDFSVELITGNRVTANLALSRYGRLAPPLEAVTSRTTYFGRSSSKTEVTPQIFAVPLADFVAEQPNLDLGAITGIRLVFDRQPKGVVVVDRIGIADTLK